MSITDLGVQTKADPFDDSKIDIDGVDESWDTEYDNARQIDWSKTPKVLVTFDRRFNFPIVDKETGESKDLEILELRDYQTRELLSTAVSYQLAEVEWTKDKLYFIECTGQESLGGGRKLNLFTVKSKAIPA